ncbi:uncharacterized protein [Chironomus tepperi]|uniref:uncharacterized protein n=1 Tax=Chironomus tepperi TaxID=113505 RepID=UPI00391F3916
MEFNLRNLIATISLIISIFITTAESLWPNLSTEKCSGGGGGNLKYLSGDALTDSLNCIGPNGLPYPSSTIGRAFGGSSRKGRSHVSATVDPIVMQSTLLNAYREANDEELSTNMRQGRSLNSQNQCGGTPSRLCKTRYNTTAPMYGVSLTSGQPVTIVQKFPDLLQQVVFEVCESSECDVVRGDCVQTYVPYLFLVIPLGPVTLTGQDYILVESGCVCKPKASKNGSSNPSVVDILP